MVCHRRRYPQYKSSGRVQMEPGDTFSQCMFGPFESSVSSEVGGHASAATPYLRTSQFCGECHDVTSPGGVRNEEAFKIIRRNTRVPEMLEADVDSEIQAIVMGAERMAELFERFGRETVDACCQAILDKTRAQTRELFQTVFTK